MKNKGAQDNERHVSTLGCIFELYFDLTNSEMKTRKDQSVGRAFGEPQPLPKGEQDLAGQLIHEPSMPQMVYTIISTGPDKYYLLCLNTMEVVLGDELVPSALLSNEAVLVKRATLEAVVSQGLDSQEHVEKGRLRSQSQSHHNVIISIQYLANEEL